MQRIYGNLCEGLHQLSLEDRLYFFNKTIKEKHTGWDDFAFHLCYEYGVRYGVTVPDDIDVEMIVSSYIVDDAYKVSLYCCEKPFIEICTYENK